MHRNAATSIDAETAEMVSRNGPRSPRARVPSTYRTIVVILRADRGTRQSGPDAEAMLWQSRQRGARDAWDVSGVS